MHYAFTISKNSDGSKLHPLRATLRALNKYGRMDKWEWYLLNTCIRHDDCDVEEATLDDYITRYRNGEYDFTMRNVVEKPKGHQYTPQYLNLPGYFMLFNVLNGLSVIPVDTWKLNQRFLKQIS